MGNTDFLEFFYEKVSFEEKMGFKGKNIFIEK